MVGCYSFDCQLVGHTVFSGCLVVCWQFADCYWLNGSWLQSWSRVMVHMAFFDNFIIPSPLPHTMLDQCTQSVPLEATSYGGRGGGDQVLEVTCFHHQTRGDDVNIANLQGVPHIAFDQDFIRILSGTFSWLIVSLLACMVCCLVWFVCQLVGCVHWMVRWLHAWQFAVLAVWLLASQLVRLVDCLYTNTCLCGWLFDWFMYYIRLLIQFHCSAWLDKSCAPL